MPEMFQNEVEMLVYKGSPKIGSKITTYSCYKNDPVDLTVVQIAKYQYNKKNNPASSSNMVDEIQNAISPLYTNCL
jgi:hypothetical protein